MTMTPPPYTSDKQYFSQHYIESDKKFVELITFMNGIAEKYPNREEMFNKVISLRETSYKAHMALYHAHDQLVRMDVGLAQVKALLRPAATEDEPSLTEGGAPLTNLAVMSCDTKPEQAHDTNSAVSELTVLEFANSETAFVTPSNNNHTKRYKKTQSRRLQTHTRHVG